MEPAVNSTAIVVELPEPEPGVPIANANGQLAPCALDDTEHR
jgi:hypothetical protein